MPTTIISAIVIVLSVIFNASALLAADIITRYPYLQPTDDMETSIGIAWETETLSDCVVQYGIKSATENKANGEHKGASPRGKQRYYAKLSNLSFGTEYRYKVVAGGAETPEYTFQTSSSRADFAWRAALLSDLHFSKDINKSKSYNEKIILQIKAFKPHVILFAGDFPLATIKDKGYAIDEEYETGFTLYRDIFANAILCPVAGNHDNTIKDSYNYWIFSEEFYLPENGPESKEDQYAFVKGVHDRSCEDF